MTCVGQGRHGAAGTRRCVLIGLLLWIGVLSPAVFGQATVVPFDFSRHEIVVQVRVNGHGPFTMLLDTGTDPSVIDLAVARQVGLKLDPVGHQGDGGGTAATLAYETSLPTIGLGGLTATDTAALAMDLSALSRRFGRPLQGVLGDSFLTGRIVQIDYPRRVVRFYPRSPFAGQTARPNTQRYSVLHFQHTGEVHLGGVLVNGHPVPANLDTGSNGAFSLTPRAVRQLGLEQAAARAKIKSGAGFNGKYVSRIGTVRRVQVGTMTVLSPPVVFWLPGTGHDKQAWGVNIGNVFLQRFIVTVDYRADQVTLERP